MDTLARLEYPDLWRTLGLYPDELRAEQEALMQKEPTQINCSTEHYRYGAFCYWLKNPGSSAATLRSLVSVAAADPDPAMAQAALIDLVAHRNCDASIYALADAAFLAFPEQYFDHRDFIRAHHERLPSYHLSK